MLSNGRTRTGGIEIVEVLPGRGGPEGDVVFAMCDLLEAEQFYNHAQFLMQDFVAAEAATA